jgi:hypothetical protein
MRKRLGMVILGFFLGIGLGVTSGKLGGAKERICEQIARCRR